MRRARKPRHSGLFAAVSRLDTEIDPAARAELARWVREQYETEYGDIPLGFMARCYLGPPYVDHRLDLLHDIVEHFAPADGVPEPFAQARMLARNDAYAFVEVYASGEIRPVFADGTVVSDSGGSAPV
ncbi:hypothetical protein [Plantactinospora sp. ZYX-F-223]|uniref:hypothetical protein n=1 Tax=Plantactinospora sp. ZYX-F-223 TaxID=3144103 RepID=UPI0031FCEBA2